MLMIGCWEASRVAGRLTRPAAKLRYSAVVLGWMVPLIVSRPSPVTDHVPEGSEVVSMASCNRELAIDNVGDSSRQIPARSHVHRRVVDDLDLAVGVDGDGGVEDDGVVAGGDGADGAGVDEPFGLGAGRGADHVGRGGQGPEALVAHGGSGGEGDVAGLADLTGRRR